jgi:hypothetical protein
MRSALATSGTVQQFYQQAASTLTFQLLKIDGAGHFVKGGLVKI